MFDQEYRDFDSGLTSRIGRDHQRMLSNLHAIQPRDRGSLLRMIDRVYRHHRRALRVPEALSGGNRAEGDNNSIRLEQLKRLSAPTNGRSMER